MLHIKHGKAGHRAAHLQKQKNVLWAMNGVAMAPRGLIFGQFEVHCLQEAFKIPPRFFPSNCRPKIIAKILNIPNSIKYR